MISDTSPEALEKWIEIQRAMPPGEKLRVVMEASEMVLRMYEMGVRAQYPDASDHEVLLRVAARHLDRETMIKAYGWDPESDERPR